MTTLRLLFFLQDSSFYFKFFYLNSQRKGERNAWLMEKLEAKFLSSGNSVESYPMILNGDPFPFLLKLPGQGKSIKGEIYELDESKTWELDRFEGTPSFYFRDSIQVENHEKKRMNCFVYFKTEVPDNLEDFEFLEEFLGAELDVS